jgi:hypothetical protein
MMFGWYSRSSFCEEVFVLRPLVVPALCLAVLLGSLAPESALAGGVPLKGKLINNRATVIRNTTGMCNCEWTWSTVSLNPGKAAFSAAIGDVTSSYGHKYSITMYVFKGANTVAGQGSASCDGHKLACGKIIKVTVNVPRRTVYYVEMRGAGVTHVWYALTVNGSIHPMHCKNYVC